MGTLRRVPTCLPAVCPSPSLLCAKVRPLPSKVTYTPYVTAEILIPRPRRRTNHFPRAPTRWCTCHTYEHTGILPCHGKCISVESPCIQLHLATTRWSRERLTPCGSSDLNDANCALWMLSTRSRYIFPYEGFRRQWIWHSTYKLRVITIIPFFLFHAKTYNFIKAQSCFVTANFDACWFFIQQEELRFHMLSFTAWLRIITELTNIL